MHPWCENLSQMHVSFMLKLNIIYKKKTFAVEIAKSRSQFLQSYIIQVI